MTTVLTVCMLGSGAAGALPEPVQRAFDRVAGIVGIDRGSDAGSGSEAAGERSKAPASGESEGSQEVGSSAVGSSEAGVPDEVPLGRGGPDDVPGPPEWAPSAGPPPHAPGPPPHAGGPPPGPPGPPG